MAEARTKAEFLASCEPQDRVAFERLFADTEALAIGLGDLSPHARAEADSSPPGAGQRRLRWHWDHLRGASLRLEHENLRKATTVLSAFPSHNHDRKHSANGLEINSSALLDGGVSEATAQRYGLDLRTAGFRDAGEKTWRTSTAGSIGGFRDFYASVDNRDALLSALKRLASAVAGD